MIQDFHTHDRHEHSFLSIVVVQVITQKRLRNSAIRVFLCRVASSEPTGFLEQILDVARASLKCLNGGKESGHRVQRNGGEPHLYVQNCTPLYHERSETLSKKLDMRTL